MTATQPASTAARPQPPAARHARRWALALAVGMLAVPALLAFEPLGPRALIDDPGIYFHLSERTARGAVPLIDFEHGWNAGAWYYGALLWWLAGGDPDLWQYLWQTVTGSLLAGLAVLAVGWRLRLAPWWLVGLAAATLVGTSVVHAKYATPALWLLVLLPVGAARRLPVALALRVTAGALMVLAHVELAVLLATGTALYDLFGARGLAPRQRLLRAAAAPAGVVAAFALEGGIYALAGLAPAEFVRQLLATPTAIDPEHHFGYPLLSPRDVRMLLFPASLVLPFVPALWRRLSDPARLVAFLHLALALIALRRTDAAHVAAASTLLAALAVLGARDVARSGGLLFGDGPVRRWPAAAAGAVWALLAVLAAFRLESLLAIVALTLLCLAGVAVARTGDRPWASAGALAGIAVVVAAGLAGAVTARAQETSGDALARRVAAEVRAPLDRCVGDDRRVWVVPYPLGLYRELDVRNPTPYVMFWYPFRDEHDRVRAMVEAGDIPAILEFNRWPLTFEGLAGDLERRYDLCAEVPIPGTGDTVRLWTLPSGGAG